MTHGTAFDGPNNDDSALLISALARYARHIAEQDYQLDLLALYQQMDDNDPLRRQCERLQAVDCPVLPTLLPLADLAIALNHLEKLHRSAR